MHKIVTIALFFGVSVQGLRGQETTQDPKKDLTNGTIAEQLEYVKTKSGNYQEYKVIKKSWYHTLASNVNDSLAWQKAEKSRLMQDLQNERFEKGQLANDLSATADSLTEVRAIQTRMRWIGIPMEKTAYRLIMWGLVLGFALLALIAFVRSLAGKRKAKQAVQDLETVQEEFEQHRKAALLREQKLRRELQDEINLRRKREGGQ